jgi:hypothetical protein
VRARSSRTVDNARVFGSITKFEKQADGTLYVEGIASSESVDSQGEIVKASAIKAAATDYLKFPAVREMHQLIAAGKALGLDVGEDGKTYIAAKIVDPIAIRKIEEGVYKGFSIGGSVPPGGRNKDDPKIIEQLKLSEISLVDRPANPDCVVTLFKAEAEPPGSAPRRPPPRACTRSRGRRSSARTSPRSRRRRDGKPTSRATIPRFPAGSRGLRRAVRHPQGTRRRGSRRADRHREDRGNAALDSSTSRAR